MKKNNNKVIKNIMKKNPNILNIFNIMLLIILTLNIIFVSLILSYLKKIKECNCIVNENKSKLNYLINIEYLLLGINIFSFIIMIMVLFITNYYNIQSGGYKNTNDKTMFIVNIIISIIYFYFILFLYKLHKNIEDCKCSESWLKYLLYIQCIVMIVFIFTNLFNLINYLM